jgi:hypothetical protein
MVSFSFNSLAMRSSPQVGFSGPLSDKRLTIRGWLCDPETQGIADLGALMALRGSRVVPTRFDS